jgi:hypothetical protein
MPWGKSADIAKVLVLVKTMTFGCDWGRLVAWQICQSHSSHGGEQQQVLWPAALLGSSRLESVYFLMRGNGAA